MSQFSCQFPVIVCPFAAPDFGADMVDCFNRYLGP